jgi:hypothetical protein
VEGVCIQQGRKRTPEHHPRGKGGGEPPRLITEAIRIAFVVHAVEAVGATHGILAVQVVEGSAAGLQLRVRFVPAALLAMLRTALALQCVSKASDWTSHVAR